MLYILIFFDDIIALHTKDGECAKLRLSNTIFILVKVISDNYVRIEMSF